MSTTPRSIQRPLRFSGTPTPTIRVTSPIPDAIAVIDIWDPEVLEEPARAPSPSKSYSIRYHPDKDDLPSTGPSSVPDLPSPTAAAEESIDLPATAVTATELKEDPHSLMVLSKLPEMETDSGSSDEDEASQATTLVRSPRSTLVKQSKGHSPSTECTSSSPSRSVSMDCSDFPPPPPSSDLVAAANLDLELPWPPVPCCTPERTSACSSMETTTPDSIPELNVHPEPGNDDGPETGTDSSRVGNRVKTSTSEKDFRRGASNSHAAASSPRRQSWSHGHAAEDGANPETLSAPADPPEQEIINQPTLEGPQPLLPAPDGAPASKSEPLASSADQRHGATESNKACMDREINIIENPSCAEEENDRMLETAKNSPELASAPVRAKKGKKVQFGRSLSYSTDQKDPTAGPASTQPDSKKYFLGRRASSYDSQSDRTAYLVVKSGSDSFSQIVEKSDTEEVEEANEITAEISLEAEEREPLLPADGLASSSDYASQPASTTASAKRGVSLIEPQQQQRQFAEGFSPIPEDDNVSITEDKPEEEKEDDHEASPIEAKPTENVEQFKKDPQLMEIATRFVADVVAKAKEEAARRAKVEKMNLELEGATRKNLPWYRRIRVVLWRAFSCTCVGSGHDLQSPL